MISLSLIYFIQILALFQRSMRRSCDAENLVNIKALFSQTQLSNFQFPKIISIERINEYIRLDKEDLTVEKHKNNKKRLPEKGEVLFDNVSFAYGPQAPLVLKNLTFRINAKEKVGIVGRTGSGKSTILHAILRMAESDGYILIDDLNIKDMSLNDLRNKISIIPVSLSLHSSYVTNV